MKEKLSQTKNRIRSSLESHIDLWGKIRKRHGYTHNTLVVLSIILSVSITIAGIFNNGTLAAIFGAILAGVLVFQQTFPFGEMSYFYRVGIAEAKILMLNLDTRADTLKEVEAIGIKVETLIYKMAQDIPRGQALHDAVSNMRDEVRETKK